MTVTQRRERRDHPAGECPNCERSRLEVFYQQDAIPVNSCILFDSSAQAREYPKGDMKLGICPTCGFVSNTAFDPRLTEYSGRYEETQGFSATFNTFHEDLARRLIERYSLHGNDILEIGCGKGEFLSLLCTLGGNRGTGFDPGFDDAREQSAPEKDLYFVKDFFSARTGGCSADFVVCKMTLEHIARPKEFLSMIREAVVWKPGAVVFFQVPEATRILRTCALEDIYYEHCSYFSPGSLRYLFESTGFEVLSEHIEYDGQYLTIEARPTATDAVPESARAPEDLETLRAYADGFMDRARDKRVQWLARVREGDPGKIVLWGSGSKAVAFLSLLDREIPVEYVVDINPHRQGSFMAGTGQRIVAPEYLQEYRPDTVTLMNPVYRGEVGRKLSEMGLEPELIAL
ncbi:MAG: class I SAM-dependent methyltransferase [Gammaproteobacteria bacterium]|jgi:SAM-dependent methyltransferase|nr:class I SAM-dependent methyltransferase [Gammaproteobacteria bacterium]